MVPQPVEYDVATSADADGIVRIIGTAFSTSEPLGRAMGISLREMEEFIQPLMPAAISEGLTMVARHKSTGELAGALLNDDFRSPLPVKLRRASTKFLPIFSLLEILDAQFRSGRTTAAGEYLHLFMLGADQRFAGCGIGQGLVKASLENGSRKGYRATVSEATARASQHIFRKLGFRDRFSVSYRDFLHDDKAVFRSIQDPPGAILMERSLLD